MRKLINSSFISLVLLFIILIFDFGKDCKSQISQDSLGVIELDTNVSLGTRSDTIQTRGNNQRMPDVKEDDPRTYRYYRIETKLSNQPDRTQDLLNKLQEELYIPQDNRLNQLQITVNKSSPESDQWYVVIGDPEDVNSPSNSWNELTPDVQNLLTFWPARSGTKVNLEGSKINGWTVIDKPYKDIFKQVKRKTAFLPPKKFRDISSTEEYINPFLQAFGGPALGLPIKKSVGFSFLFGTPYSGPMETDLVSAGFDIIGISINITSRVKEFVAGTSGGDTDIVPANKFIANYNNIYAPHLGLEVDYVIPFLKILKVGLFTTIDSGDYDPPVRVLDTKTNTILPNNVISGNYFNWELRYPFLFFNSSISKVYFGQQFAEFHLGFLAREVYIDESLFDIRTDMTFGSSKRNFQWLIEAMVANIASSFARNSFAIGPSVRLGISDTGNFGLLTVLLNMRLKIGDYWEREVK